MIAPIALMLLAQTAPESAATLVRRLNADLLEHPSATAVLARWCAARSLGDPAEVRAVVDRSVQVAPGAEQRARLKIGPDEVVGYRRVNLMCGDHVLSRAENWYVPARLTPEMNAALEGDAPFGTVIRPLAPSRQSLSAVLLWTGEGEDVPEEVLRHSALVLDANGRPLAEVSERYQRILVAPPAP